MTGEELEHLRKSRKLTRAELAEELGNCTASTIVNWESGRSPVPVWVEEKMLQKVRVDLPLDELNALVNLAIKRGLNFEDILAEAITRYVEAESKASMVQGAAALAEESSGYQAPPEALKAKRSA